VIEPKYPARKNPFDHRPKWAPIIGHVIVECEFCGVSPDAQTRGTARALADASMSTITAGGDRG
jgi:hypothetical protein